MRKKSKQQTADERKLALGLRLSAVYVKRLPHFVLMRQPLLLSFDFVRNLGRLCQRRKPSPVKKQSDVKPLCQCHLQLNVSVAVLGVDVDEFLISDRVTGLWKI